MSNEIIVEKLIHKGAEASLYYGSWFGKEAIFKKRIPKRYRIEQIDKILLYNRLTVPARDRDRGPAHPPAHSPAARLGGGGRLPLLRDAVHRRGDAARPHPAREATCHRRRAPDHARGG